MKMKATAGKNGTGERKNEESNPNQDSLFYFHCNFFFFKKQKFKFYNGGEKELDIRNIDDFSIKTKIINAVIRQTSSRVHYWKKKFVDAEIFEKKVLEHVFIIATRIFRETKALIKNLFLKKSQDIPRHAKLRPNKKRS